MIIFKHQKLLRQYLDNQGLSNRPISFVPTMGALHEGHISLIKQAQGYQNAPVVCSIFVNPTQFNNQNDFNKYPITIDSDIAMLSEVKCDFLYLPGVEDIYPNGTNQLNKYHLLGLDTRLEGEFRPGHFQGVANVVHRLIDATSATDIFMGAKDYQQCQVVQALINEVPLSTKLHICATLREPSGLAMSSRNQRLSSEGKQKAAVIYQSLQHIKENYHKYSFAEAQDYYISNLASKGLEYEHLILARQSDLQQLTDFDAQEKMVLLTAAFCEGVRLIDNLELN